MPHTQRLKSDKLAATRWVAKRRHCTRQMRFSACILLSAMLTGCAAYHPAPLPTAPELANDPAQLAHQLPNGGQIDTAAPLSLRDIAALAVLNNPDLRATRAQHNVAAAELMTASALPDPSITGGFAALLGGPGTMPAISGALSQDIGALITYKAGKQAAKAGLEQVDAGIIWQEWQTAAQAEQLAVTLCADQETLRSLQQDTALLSGIDQATQTEIGQNNLTLNDGAASMTALAISQSASASAAQAAQHDAAALDALLGLQPGTPITIAPPMLPTQPPGILAPALASLPERRPDLIALRYGYQQADAKLRAAILTQFLPLSLGAGGGRDTTGVVSAGPQITLTLPLFNRNRGAIKTAEATRAVLAAQYQAALDNAAGGAQALASDIALLQAQATEAQAGAQHAASMAAAARTAFAQGQINATALSNLQTAAGERQRNFISLRSQLQRAQISLVILLGLGLPPLGEGVS
jgi:outer membrane protein TolC